MKSHSTDFVQGLFAFFAIQVVLCLAGSLFPGGILVLPALLLSITFGLFAMTVFEQNCKRVFEQSSRYIRSRLRSIMGSGLLVGGFLFLLGLVYGLTRG